MTTFIATATKDGGFDLGSEYNRIRLKNKLKETAGKRWKIEEAHIESKEQRRFFEGAVIKLIVYYQEGMHHKNQDDCFKVREWLKMEFNPEMVVIGGKSQKIAGSTLGKLQAGFLEKVIEWMDEQGYQTEVLDPKKYKYWRDVIYPYGGPDNYIDYLVETKQLKNVQV